MHVFRVCTLTCIFLKDINMIITLLDKDDLTEVMHNMVTNKRIPGISISGANYQSQVFCHDQNTHIITPHNDWKFNFNKHDSQ
jgi:hypothetical protein